VLDVPRSARLAAWGTAVLQAACSPAAAVRAVTDQDEPHEVAADPEVTGVGHDLSTLFVALGALGATGLRLVLPVPGDLIGLGGPRAFNERAVTAGESVVVDAPAGAWGLSPTVTPFGSDLEPGHLVAWQVMAANPAPPAGRIGLAEAEQTLRLALVEATKALTTLDIARWREDHSDAVLAVRDGVLAPQALPPSLPERAHRAAATAARVRAIVELAVLDDGAAISSRQADLRRQALREVDAVARRGLVAAVNAALEPGR
jgi:hypothetical protein